MYFADNIRLLRKRRKRSQDDVATTLGIKRTTLCSYENGSTEPSMDTLIRFSEYFKVSLDKLIRIELTKVSESLLSEIEKGHDIDISGNRLRVLATTVNSQNEENIELVPIKAKAGYTAGFADPSYIKVLQAFSLPFLDRNRKYRSFEISGDSMPPVPHGSWVVGEYVENWNYIKDGYPYIILTKDEGIVFKSVYNKINERKSLMLVSTNPEYQPYEIDISEVLEVWKFSTYMSRELPEPNISKDGLSNTLKELRMEIAEIKTELKRQNGIQMKIF
jgi:transcriptional regulator with XRE-family HTH domain